MLNKRGFTLIEIMVAITIITILSGVVFISSQDASKKSRDAERQADLKALQTAVELYKLKYGRYPRGCNGPSTAMNQPSTWSGQVGTNYDCPTATDGNYIIDLAPEFIPVLPTDPKLNGTDSGYVYTVNNDGSVYKIMALNTVESEVVEFTHPLYRCGTGNPTFGSHECVGHPNGVNGGVDANGNDTYVYNSGGGTQYLNQCNQASEYEDVYAVFGGYSDGDNVGGFKNSRKAREYLSDIVRCK